MPADVADQHLHPLPSIRVCCQFLLRQVLRRFIDHPHSDHSLLFAAADQPTMSIGGVSDGQSKAVDESTVADVAHNETDAHEQHQDSLPTASQMKKAADFSLLDASGNSVQFSTLYKPSDRSERTKTLIIFVRHFFCGVCDSSLFPRVEFQVLTLRLSYAKITQLLFAPRSLPHPSLLQPTSHSSAAARQISSQSMPPRPIVNIQSTQTQPTNSTTSSA